MIRDAKNVLITGASTGIGAACAVELARRGFRVFAGVRGEAAVEQIRKAAPGVMPISIDVTQADSIAAAREAIEAAVGPAGLWGLVNNAGVVVPAPIELIPLDDLRRQFEVNVIGQVAVTQAMLGMIRGGGGRIVNMGSISGLVGAAYIGAYSATKHALEAVTEALRMELRPWNIAVSIIEPPSIQTPIWGKAADWSDTMLGKIPPEAEALYGDALRKARKAVDRFARTALPVGRVVRCVVHALEARWPKARYPVGIQAKLAAVLWPIVPAWLRDRIVRGEMGQ